MTMNRDDDGARQDSWELTARGGAFDREVVGAYDEVGGHPAFVIAALDEDDAWIAVPAGTECDVDEWH